MLLLEYVFPIWHVLYAYYIDKMYVSCLIVMSNFRPISHVYFYGCSSS
jgi:hypothetical protein